MAVRERFITRQAKLSDLQTLVRHRRLMWENMGEKDVRELNKADNAYRAWARARIRNKTMRGWIIENSGGIIAGSGCLWLQPVQPRPGRSKGLQPYLLSMYTMPQYRGKGLASRIVREAVNWTKRNKYDALKLHASEMGRGVYGRLGFTRSWEMRRNLSHR